MNEKLIFCKIVLLAFILLIPERFSLVEASFLIWFTHTPVVYPEDEGTITLIYKNILSLVYYEMWRNGHASARARARVCEREKERERERERVEWTGNCFDTMSLQSLSFSCFFHGRLIQSASQPGTVCFSGLAPQTAWHLMSLCSALWLPIDRWLLGLKTSVVIYFSGAYALFLNNSQGLSAVPCLAQDTGAHPVLKSIN